MPLDHKNRAFIDNDHTRENTVGEYRRSRRILLLGGSYMSVPRRHLSALAFSVIFTTGTELAFSGQDEIVMIGGAGFALVVVEKCTGVAPPADYIPRIRAGITRAGISDEDFRQGFASGAMKAEMKYRGKPPAQECKDAKTLKAQIDKAFL